MGFKIRALFKDGREDHMDTADLLDRQAYPDAVPVGLVVSLNVSRAEERGVWIRYTVADGGRCRNVEGHGDTLTPQLAPCYDVRLWSAQEVAGLNELTFDGFLKLKRVAGHLVNLSALQCAAAEHLSQIQESEIPLVQMTCEVFLRIEQAEGGAADREEIARRIGWKWEALEPLLLEYEADLDAQEDSRDEPVGRRALTRQLLAEEVGRLLAEESEEGGYDEPQREEM